MIRQFVEQPAERSASTISQSTDRAEARIAILKADLRLSADQAQHWAGLESVLHDIVAKRAKSWAASRDLQTHPLRARRAHGAAG